MARFFSPLFVLLIGCSEYDLSHKGSELPGDGDTGTDADPGDDAEAEECGALSVDPVGFAIDESCEVIAEVGSWSPELEWSSSAPGDAYTTPVIGQLTDDNGDGLINDDDMPDVVVAGTTGRLVVMSGDGGAVHWQVSGLGSEPSTPAIADLDGDGRPEVVASGSGGFFAYRGDTGTVMWTSGGSYTQNICGGVGVYDLDGDGRPEVVQGARVLDGLTGALLFTGAHGAGSGYTSGYYASFGVAADIDLDGTMEVVVGNALYDPSGATIWHNGQSDGFVAVGDFDDDDFGEIVVTTFPGRVRLQDDDGTVLWSGAYTGSTIGPPTVADFDSDGEAEIGVAGNGVYVVIDGDGSQLWQRSINDYSSGFTGSAVFDFEGDGEAEVVFADENDVWVFKGATGEVKLRETRHSSATCSEYPSIADVDNDGQTEIIYTSSAYSGTESGVRVIGDSSDSWRPARTTWNQHSYAITNVEGPSASIPTDPEPNWLSYNTFRSGDLASATGGAFADAIPQLGEACTLDCDEGQLLVTFYIGNGGVADLPAGVPVSLYAERGGVWELISTDTTASAIAPGDSEGFSYTLPSDDAALRFVVDDDGGVTEVVGECHEDNNVVEVRSGLCP